MAMTPEAKVKKKVAKQLDDLGCYLGMFFGIELKAGNNKPTPLQEKNLQQITNAEGLAIVVNEDNMHDIQAIFWEAYATHMDS